MRLATTRWAAAAILLLTLAAGCTSSSSETTTAQPIEPATTTTVEATTTTIAEAISTYTDVTVDGHDDDWETTWTVSTDPAGDQSEGDVDLAEARAFTNDQYLYLYFSSHGDALIDEMISLSLAMEDSEYQLNLFPHGDAEVARPVGGPFETIEVAMEFGTVVEAKVSLEDLGGIPRQIEWIDACCDESGEFTDTMDGGPIETVDALEPEPPATRPAAVNEVTERPAHASILQTGEPIDYLYRSFLQIPIELTWGPDGVMYTGDWAGRHIVRISKDGTMDDLGLWRSIEAIQSDGPRTVAFDAQGTMYFSTYNGIYRIGHDGVVEELQGVDAGLVGSIVISPDDQLYFTDRDAGEIRRWNPDGTSSLIVGGLEGAEVMAFADANTLYVTQVGIDVVARIDLDSGAIAEFARWEDGDQAYLAIDAEGDVWIRGPFRLIQYAPDGTEKPFVVDGRTFPSEHDDPWKTAGGVAFDDEGALWVASYTSRVLRLIPTSDGPDPEFTTDTIVPGVEIWALATGANGEVFATNSLAAELWRFSPESEPEVLAEYPEAEGRTALAVADDGSIFLGLSDHRIVRVGDDGRLTDYADLLTHRMEVGSDGALYAVVGDWDQEKSIVRISGPYTYTTLTTDIGGTPLGSSEVVISSAGEDGFYVLLAESGQVFLMDHQGQGSLMAELPGTNWLSVIAASPTSRELFYLTESPHIWATHVGADGATEQIAGLLEGDPFGLAVSQDGKWLYVAESGVIDMIPLPERWQ